MRVFFSFGNTQLRFVVLRHPLAKGVCQRCWRIRARRFDVCGVFGQLDEIEVHHFFAGKTVEVAVNERTGDFTRAVSAEVHEDQRVTIFHGGVGLAFSADH